MSEWKQGLHQSAGVERPRAAEDESLQELLS